MSVERTVNWIDHPGWRTGQLRRAARGCSVLLSDVLVIRELFLQEPENERFAFLVCLCHEVNLACTL